MSETERIDAAIQAACTDDTGVRCAYPDCQGPDGSCDFAPGFLCGWGAALAAARSPAPEWRPTHRHYKGGLYRKIGEGIHTETSEPLTFYDNAKGELFARPTAMFNDLAFDKPVLRFTPLPSPPEDAT